jgi:hypothetical protein
MSVPFTVLEGGYGYPSGPDPGHRLDPTGAGYPDPGGSGHHLETGILHYARGDFIPRRHGHADSMGAANKHPLDRSIADHHEPITDRVDVPERTVDPVTPVDVDGKGAAPAFWALVASRRSCGQRPL